jgi:hypothetical protein
MNVYATVKAFSLPHIKAFHNDLLVHDKKLIADNPGVPFLHWTRDSGTDILFLPELDAYPARGVRVPYLFGTADRNHLVKSAKVICEYRTRQYATPQNVVLHYTGKTIKVIGVQRAAEIGRDYYNRLMSEIDRQENVARNARELLYRDAS